MPIEPKREPNDGRCPFCDRVIRKNYVKVGMLKAWWGSNNLLHRRCAVEMGYIKEEVREVGSFA